MKGVENRCLGYHKQDNRFPGRHFKRPEGEYGKLVLDVAESLKMNADRIRHYAREYGTDAELLTRNFEESLVVEAENPHNLEYLARLASGHSTRFSREVKVYRGGDGDSNTVPDRRRRRRSPQEIGIRDEDVGAGDADLALEEEDPLGEQMQKYA